MFPRIVEASQSCTSQHLLGTAERSVQLRTKWALSTLLVVVVKAPKAKLSTTKWTVPDEIHTSPATMAVSLVIMAKKKTPMPMWIRCGDILHLCSSSNVPSTSKARKVRRETTSLRASAVFDHLEHASKSICWKPTSKCSQNGYHFHERSAQISTECRALARWLEFLNSANRMTVKNTKHRRLFAQMPSIQLLTPL